MWSLALILATIQTFKYSYNLTKNMTKDTVILSKIESNA